MIGRCVVPVLVAALASAAAGQDDAVAPLHRAAQKGKHSTASKLLKAGADPNAADEQGRTALHMAAANNQSRLIVLLIKYKATVDTRAKSGATPLHEAALKGHAKAMEALLKAGADPNLKLGDGSALVTVVATGLHRELTTILHRYGAKVDETVLKQLVEALKKSGPKDARQKAEALGSMGPAAVKPLMAYLKGPGPTELKPSEFGRGRVAREAVFRGLAAAGPAAAPELIPYLNDKDNRAAAMASQAFSSMRGVDEKTAELLVASIEETTYPGLALQTLGFAVAGNRKLAPHLARILRHPTADMRYLAAYYAGCLRLRTTEIYAGLAETLNDTDERVALASVQALVVLGEAKGKHNKDVRALLRKAAAKAKAEGPGPVTSWIGATKEFPKTSWTPADREPAAPPLSLARRAQRQGLRKEGGSGLTENAVELGLRWLASHQDLNGSWDSNGFMKHDLPEDRCDGPGRPMYDVGVTSLALLAFLGAGHAPGSKDNYDAHVEKGLGYLASAMDKDGFVGSRKDPHAVYNHGYATIALLEAYALTGRYTDRVRAQKAITACGDIRRANRSMAWRYLRASGENDTSATAMMLQACDLARSLGLWYSYGGAFGGKLWMYKMTDPEFGQVGYNVPGGNCARPLGLTDKFPPEKAQSCTAMSIYSRILNGDSPRRDEITKKGIELCLMVPPKWDFDDGSIDLYYWYWGTMACFQVGGSSWKKWNEIVKDALVKHQHPRGAGAREGSWDPIGAWGSEGGRVYSTAIATLTLETYYRYPRRFGK